MGSLHFFSKYLVVCRYADTPLNSAIITFPHGTFVLHATRLRMEDAHLNCTALLTSGSMFLFVHKLRNGGRSSRPQALFWQDSVRCSSPVYKRQGGQWAPLPVQLHTVGCVKTGIFRVVRGAEHKSIGVWVWMCFSVRQEVHAGHEGKHGWQLPDW